MPTSERSLILGVNLIGSGFHQSAWRSPDGVPDANIDIDVFVRGAVAAEAAGIDAVFLADNPVLHVDVNHAPPIALEPTVVLAAVASATERIGLIGTLSTSYNDPYNVARRLSSLDHITRGRAGWNIVTSAGDQAARNFSMERALGHPERYERATEFVEVALGLWNAWSSTAYLGDKVTGRWADKSQIVDVDHHGPWFQVAGPLTMPSSPQRVPLLVQAGSSADGLDFACRYAELLFCVQSDIDASASFVQDVRARAIGYGRAAGAVRVLPGLMTVLGSSDDEARRRWDELDALQPLAFGVQNLAKALQVAPGILEPDAELPYDVLEHEDSLRVSPSQFKFIVELGRRERLTVRDLVRRLGGRAGNGVVVGSPITIADHIERWFSAGAADGFILAPDVLPSGAEDFYAHVLPILIERRVFRPRREGATLRERLGLPEPTWRENP